MDKVYIHINYTLPLWMSPKHDHMNTGAIFEPELHSDAPRTTMSQPPGDRKDGSGRARVAVRQSYSKRPLASPRRMLATRWSRQCVWVPPHSDPLHRWTL